MNIWLYIASNWKNWLVAAAAFVLSVQQFVTALQQSQAGQKADWKGAIIALLIAALAAVAKMGTNHSTIAQIQKATIEKPDVEAATKQTPAVPK